MKNKIIIGLIWLLLLNIVIAVPMPPQPIGGRIYGGTGSVDNLKVILTSKDTGESVIVFSNSDGEWLVDWANTKYGYRHGDEIDIVVWICQADCQKTVTIEGIPIFVEFNVTAFVEQECPICPVCPTIPTTTICPEIPEECFSSAECYEMVDCIVICEDWGYIMPEDCPKPIVTLQELIVSLIIALGVGFSLHAGYKFVLRETKEGKIEMEITQHKHKGKYEYYHGIHRKHADKKYRHPVNKEEVMELVDLLVLPDPDNYKVWIYNPQYNIDGEKFPS